MISAFAISAFRLFPVGDPTVLGWATFAFYMLAAGVCFRSARTGGVKGHESQFARSWRILAVLLLLLGVNKQLDLQTALIELGRRLALAAGVYGHRRDIHLSFFLGLVVGLIVAVVACRKPLTAFASTHPVCMIGFGLVCAYAFIRAASFDHVDQLLGFDLEKAPGLWVLEVGGLLLVIAKAIQSREQMTEDR